MSDIDAKIRAALEADDDSDLLKDSHDIPLLEQVVHTFRGRSRWLVAMTMIVTLVAMAFAVWCLVEFFGTTDVVMMLRWGGGVAFCFAAVMAMKVWYWMELNRHAMVREIKRFEIHLARIAREVKR